MQLVSLFALCLTYLGCSDEPQGRYTVVAPGTIHSSKKYTAAVSVHDVSGPCELKIGITGPSYNETKSVHLSQGEVKQVDFEVPALKEGTYNLTAEGVSGIEFKNSTSLNMRYAPAYTKIQTGRGIYKPGDVVDYRVLFLDENLRPAQAEKDAVIWFEDAKRNRINEIKNFTLVKGVYTGKLQLSTFPVLGNWRMVVENGRERDQAYFDVQKYVLPKYEISLDASPDVAVQDGDMQVVVRANYTYGKPVDGKVILMINLNVYNYGDDKDRKEPPTIIRTTDMVKGKAKFNVNVKEYESYMISKDSAYYASITATVEEQFTEVKLNTTGSSTFWPYRYQFNCVSYGTCNNYYADEEAEVVYHIVRVDGIEVKDTKSCIKLTYKEELNDYRWRNGNETLPVGPINQNRTFTFESRMNETGQAVFKVKLPALEEREGFSHYFSIQAEYAGEKRNVGSTFEMKRRTEEEPKVEEPTEWFTITPNFKKDSYSFTLGEEATFTVNSSEPLSYFVYHITGRGNVLESGYVEVTDCSTTHNVTIKPTFLMIPSAIIYAYYVNKCGQLNFTESFFSVETELPNKIDISTPKLEVRPGEDVQLIINTEQDSFVGLLAVDQSSLLLRSNNDIRADDFSWRLGRYTTQTPYQGGYSPYPGQQSGLVTMTNAEYPYNRTFPYNDFVLYSTKRISAEGFRVVGGVAPNAVSAVAAVAADSAAGGSAGAPIRVRKNFEETWIFHDIKNTPSQNFTWSMKIPDTLTTWVLTGFSVHPHKGLGVANTTNIKTFQPFFIEIRLPYSMKRGEVINVPALVFNYMNKDLDVAVSLENPNDEFDFMEPSNEVIHEPKRMKVVRVPAMGAGGVSFLLRPKTVGNTMLKFTAISPLAGDAVMVNLKVEPEGTTEYANRAYLVNLKDSMLFRKQFQLDLPVDIVPDSQYTEFSVVGDLLGPVLRNINDLIRLPTGCGEQTISKMVPNYLVYRYLTAIGKLAPEMESKIRRNIEFSYQHILTFRHSDGSFSSFGPSTDPKYPNNGSTWLTAYVIRSLSEVQEIITVDPKVKDQGLKFLLSKQAENGSFVENGDVFYRDQSDLLTLTSNVLLAFLENKNFTSEHSKSINRGFMYLYENWEKSESIYAKAIATYALNQAALPQVHQFIAKLKTLAKTEDDRMWWSQRDEMPNSRLWWRVPYRGEVETTSYVLMSLLSSKKENAETVLPIIKWLIAQRNSYGGFWSSHDTVVGIRALTDYAIKNNYTAAEMVINIRSNGKMLRENSITANADNALVYQSVELPQGTVSVDFEARGKGSALVQVSYQYNVLEKDPKPSFTIEIQLNQDTPKRKLELLVCVDYTGDGQGSNMAVLEVSLPSGYVHEQDLEELKSNPRVRHVETKKEDTVVVIYFASLLSNNRQCLPIEAVKTYDVAMQKPSFVNLYDYYEPAKRATDSYCVMSTLCDICDPAQDEDCRKQCNTRTV